MGYLASVSGADGNAEITPIIKFNSVNGLISLVERTKTATGWVSEDISLQYPVKFVADLANMEAGPMAFLLNRPDFHTVKIADMEAGLIQMPARPTPEHKTGFLVRVYSKSIGLREWRGQAKCVLNAIDDIYEQFKVAPEAKQGLCPVLEISGTTPLKREGQYPGTDMQPNIVISQWVPRPEALTVPDSTPPSAGPNVVPLPAAPAANGAQNRVPPAPTTASAGVRRAPGHVPPPKPTAQQTNAAQAMMTPSSAEGTDDAPEFV